MTPPRLPTAGVGSWAAPAWLTVARRRHREGVLGEGDLEEALQDAVRAAVGDQLAAGLDVVSDGELARQRFVYEMYDRLAGLRRLPTARRVGVPGYDQAPRFEAVARVTAPDGLGLVEDLRRLRQVAAELARLAGRPAPALKVALPGPLTFAGAIELGPAYGPGNAGALLADLVAAVRAELEALAAEGPDWLQLDEPALTRLPHGLGLEAAVAVINRTLDGVPGALAVHVCYGNNAGRPFAERGLARLVPALARLRCRQLVLEFANRELAEVERLADLARTHAIAAGVVDVKSFHEETPEEVAARIRRVLAHVPAERLTVTADCGFSACPRWLARAKARALVAGARLVRASLP